MSKKEAYSTEGPTCPYCGYRITPDDGFFYDEMRFTEMECDECGKMFDVRVYVSTSWATSPHTYALFLDDERYPPHEKVRGLPWVIVRSYDEFFEYINKNGFPHHISFDHDLGEGPTGNSIATEVATRLIEAEWPEYVLPPGFTATIHSMNSVGRDNIKATLIHGWGVNPER